MKVKEESGKVGLKLNVQKTKIMVSSPITSWEIDGETVETVSDFILGGSKITADGDCSHEIKRRLLLGRKVMTNLDSILKSRVVTLPTKVLLVKAMVFPVVMYGGESWTTKDEVITCTSVQFSSFAQSCLTLCNPMDCSTPASLSTNSRSLLKLMSIESVMPSNHLILCHPLLLPSIFPSIRVFSNESVLHIRWPKYWSFSFSICPSSGHSGLISFRMDWLDLLAVQGTLKSLLQHHS